jgi:hypothetical protein
LGQGRVHGFTGPRTVKHAFDHLPNVAEAFTDIIGVKRGFVSI